MIGLLLFAQVAVSTPTPAAPDSVYETPALRALVAAAAVANRASPERLASYRAQVETELSFLIRDSVGRERTAQIEQVAATATWNRASGYELHVIGYRSESLGVPFSALSILRGWTVPMLYGERLLLGIEPGSSATRVTRRGARNDTVIAVHPLASDRDAYYRYTGGDTVTTLRAGARAIPIVRVRVQPRFDADRNFTGFDGELHVDAIRNEIVRMRGRFVERRESDEGRRSLLGRLTGVVAVAYVEFVNAEVAGRYWLPAMQRLEFQAGMAALGENRSVFRVVTHFRGYEVNDSIRIAGLDAQARSQRRRVTYAPSDSLSRHDDWVNPLGTATTEVSSNDFEDLAPRRWAVGGPPRISFYPAKFEDVFRYNRVEGLYTGAALHVDFREAFPGLAIRAHGGWAWTQGTMRGGVSVAQRRGATTVGLRGERMLAITNDFPFDMESTGSAFGALFGSVDDFDYVDRSVGGAWISHTFERIDIGVVTAQGSWRRDGAEPARLTKGLIAGDERFRPNRPAYTGSYAHGSVIYEYHPTVSGDFLEPGIGARVQLESATGDLDWTRAEAAIFGRRYVGPFSVASRLDAGVVTSARIPPQTLFELGGTARLPGYDYKEFVGDRAAVGHGSLHYAFPWRRAPIRIGRYFLPGISPGVGVSVQGGWTELSSQSAREAAALFATDSASAPTPTDGVRGSFGGGLTFFSGLLHVGAARAIERGARWKASIGFGRTF